LKKLIPLFLALLVALSIFPGAVQADPSFRPESISTPNICLMDAASGSVLYEKKAQAKAFPASTTKIMTCILALEQALDLNEIVTVGNSVETKGSCIKILPGEKMPLIDLIYGMMLESGNDAARAIAEHISGSESAFAELMNQKAATLGMTGTKFTKANGLHNEDHYTTAYDMALLTRYAMRNDTFRKIVSTKTYNAAPTNRDSDGYQWQNTNKLIHTKAGETSYEYLYATGVKTGDTNYAGRCLAASAKKNGVELILILFGDEGSNTRFQSAAKLFDWGFENYMTLDVATLGLENTLEAAVANADASDAENGLLTLTIDFTGATISALRSTIEAIQQDPSLLTATKAIDKLEAPIEAGAQVGMVSYQYGGTTLFTAPVYASRAVFTATQKQPGTEPGSSPLAIETPGPAGNEKKSHAWVFWLCLAIALALIVFIARIFAAHRRRRRAPRRRKAYRARIVR